MTFLCAAEDRKSFFRRVALYYPTFDPRYKLIEKAYQDAKDAFRGKFRDDGETRYFEHIRAVALILLDYLRVKDHELIVAALLHDIVEDKDEWTIERVQLEYGERIALLVEYLTKPSKKDFPGEGEVERVYHSRFESAPRDFFLIKLADRFHNVYTLWSCNEEKRRRKIEETWRYYMPHAERHLILLHELEEELEKVEQGLANPAL
jgi:(p)ppGpp synthase/HD superfamily hydrolase